VVAQTTYTVPNYGYMLRVSDFDFVWAPYKQMANAKVEDKARRPCANQLLPQEMFVADGCRPIASSVEREGWLSGVAGWFPPFLSR